MNFCSVEWTTTSADEHLDSTGLSVLVELSYDDNGLRKSNFRTRVTHPMDWLQGEADSALKDTAAKPLDDRVALSIWSALGEVRISPAVQGTYGFMHAWTSKLKISSMYFSGDFSWHGELPPEWSAFDPVVRLLKAVGSDQ